MWGGKTLLLLLMANNCYFISAQSIKIINNSPALEPISLDVVNSPSREINLSITPNGRYLFFMSLRGGNPWSTEGYSIFRGEPRFDGDIWYSKKIDNQWTAPVCLPEGVNTSSAEDEPNVSPDGNYVLYQSWKDSWISDGGPYYYSRLSGDQWGPPEGMSGGVNQYFKIEFRKNDGYATDGAALSPDGKIFLVALAPDYNDSMDVYISRRQNGIWSYLKKTSLSTEGDERSLFIAADNKTVYFASNGLGGFGSMDIFKTTLNDDDTFGEILNVGEPFNSPEDDMGFIVTSFGNESYFVRSDDIYYCDLRLANPEIKPLSSVIISGVVTDIFGYPLESDITLTQKSTGELKGESTSNSKTGEYIISILKEEGDYIKEVKAKDYKPSLEEISLDVKSENEITSNTVLVEENTALLHYGFDEFLLTDTNKNILDSIAGELFQDRSLRIILEGHTDEKGTDGYNSELSKKRVKEAGQYLLTKGIPKGVMKLNHYGETKPRVGLEIVNHEAINRRVEIKFIHTKKK